MLMHVNVCVCVTDVYFYLVMSMRTYVCVHMRVSVGPCSSRQGSGLVEDTLGQASRQYIYFGGDKPINM